MYLQLSIYLAIYTTEKIVPTYYRSTFYSRMRKFHRFQVNKFLLKKLRLKGNLGLFRSKFKLRIPPATLAERYRFRDQLTRGPKAENVL